MYQLKTKSNILQAPVVISAAWAPSGLHRELENLQQPVPRPPSTQAGRTRRHEGMARHSIPPVVSGRLFWFVRPFCDNLMGLLILTGPWNSTSRSGTESELPAASQRRENQSVLFIFCESLLSLWGLELKVTSEMLGQLICVSLKGEKGEKKHTHSFVASWARQAHWKLACVP